MRRDAADRLAQALASVEVLGSRASWKLSVSESGVLTATSPEQSFNVPLADVEEVVRYLSGLTKRQVTDAYGSNAPYAFADKPMKAFAKELQYINRSNTFLAMTRSYAVPGMQLLSAVALAGGAQLSLNPSARIVAIEPEQLRAAGDFFDSWNEVDVQTAPSPPEGSGGPARPLPPLSMSAQGILDALLRYRNVVLEGVAGTGKSFAIGELSGRFSRTYTLVLHPSTGYEDLVEGLRPISGGFRTEDGVFLGACKEAAANPDKTYLVVLDEVNRANTARVMGDLLLAIEPSKRVSAETAHIILNATDPDHVRATYPFAVELQALREPAVEGDEHYRAFLAVPENVFVLATMNTTDRSVGQLDLALRRRFVPYRISPMSAAELAAALPEESSMIDHMRLWETLNDAIRDEVSPDAMLGHSYFFEFADATHRPASSPSSEPLSAAQLWSDLLLPQLGEVLVAFGATEHLQGIQTRVRGQATSTPVDWLSVHGDGLEVGVVIKMPAEGGKVAETAVGAMNAVDA